MKTQAVLFLSVIFLIGFSSCGSNKSKTDTDKNATEQMEDSQESNKIVKAKDCDEFIDQYEEWMNNYIDMIDKYMKNPTDPTLLNDYMRLSQEGMNWMNQWNSKLYYCASQDKYQERFDEISEKAEKKLKELGLE